MSDSAKAKLARVLRVLKDGEPDMKMKALAVLARPEFAGYGPVLAAVTDALLRGDRSDFRAYKVRVQAAQTLAAIGGEQALTALTYALEDEHTAVQLAAVEALAALDADGVQVVAALQRALTDDSPAVRTAAIRALVTLPEAAARPYPALIPLLADRDEAVRDAARAALGEAGAEAVPVLIAALDEDDSTLRGEAASLLGASRDERARNPLRKLASDDRSSWVKARADAALDALPKETFVQPKVRRDPPPEAPGTLDQLRKDAPQWSRHGSTEALTVDQIQAMLDSLDLRFMRGEITEALYLRLQGRWQQRLNEVMGDP